MTTGSKLTSKLAETGTSKRKLAEMSGVSYKTVRRVCNGDRRGSLDTWMRFAEALGCNVDDLIG